MHEHTPAGEQAAEQEVAIPRHDSDPIEHGSAPPAHPTGEGRARINREEDPPA